MWHEILEKPIGGSAKRQHINFLAKKMNGGNESNQLGVGESSSRLGALSRGRHFSLFDMLVVIGGGFKNFDIPLVVHPLRWFICLLGRGSFHFLPTQLGKALLNWQPVPTQNYATNSPHFQHDEDFSTSFRPRLFQVSKCCLSKANLKCLLLLFFFVCEGPKIILV